MKHVGRNTVPPMLDKCFANMDQSPFYCDALIVCSWTKQGVGRRNKKNFRGQIGTGEGEGPLHSTVNSRKR